MELVPIGQGGRSTGAGEPSKSDSCAKKEAASVVNIRNGEQVDYQLTVALSDNVL